MKHAHALIAITAIIIAALSGCASAGTSPAAVVTPASAPAPVADPAPDPAPSTSAADCTTHACIAEDAKSSLVGGVAKDESVMTALDCYKSTVKNPDPGVYTVHCKATYSDGSEWDGIASVLLSQDRVTWEPTEEVQ